jgi:hypothetical protein
MALLLLGGVSAIVLIAILIVGLITLLALVMGPTYGWCPQKSDPPCALDVLLFSLDDLSPGDWTEIGSRSSKDVPDRVCGGKAGTIFSSNRGALFHTIYWLWSEGEARREFAGDVAGWFSKRNDETEWLTPADLSQLLVQADEYQLRCSQFVSTGYERCHYFARYGQYLIWLSMDSRANSDAEMRRMVNETDHRMHLCLGR